MSDMDDPRTGELAETDLSLYAGACPAATDGIPTLREGTDRFPSRCTEIAGPPLRRILEAILFANDRPVLVEQVRSILPDRDAGEIERELEAMARDYVEMEAGFRLLRTAGGFQIRTDPEMHEYVTRFLIGKKRTRLSRAAMETLAIIAYRQPITRGECEDVRGVDSGQVIHTLLERNLITVRGRSQALGRPLLYGTTEEFLRYFGLNALADLPSPEELDALLGDDPLEDPEIREALRAGGLDEPSVAPAVIVVGEDSGQPAGEEPFPAL